MRAAAGAVLELDRDISLRAKMGTPRLTYTVRLSRGPTQRRTPVSRLRHSSITASANGPGSVRAVEVRFGWSGLWYFGADVEAGADVTIAPLHNSV